MINNRVYVELLFNSNCVSSFLEKRGCSHAQLIIESRISMWVEHVLKTKWPSVLDTYV